ncbi:MAG: hypothetical protein K8R86_01635 [Bacteroidales bacterium]|nr:hypothetical protein [Bacteroidales bacterium]
MFFKNENSKIVRDENEISKYKDLFTICDQYFHDRLIISNYLYYQSGRSFDINMRYDIKRGEYVLTKYSSVDLFSVLNRSKFKQINTYIDIYNKLVEIKKREEYKKFFED